MGNCGYLGGLCYVFSEASVEIKTHTHLQRVHVATYTCIICIYIYIYTPVYYLIIPRILTDIIPYIPPFKEFIARIMRR